MALGSVASKAVTPGNATQTVGAFTTGFDSSGWSVNLGSGSASATASKVSTPIPAVSNNTMMLLLLAGAAFILMKK